MSKTNEVVFKINFKDSILITAPSNLKDNEEDDKYIAAYVTTGNDD